MAIYQTEGWIHGLHTPPPPLVDTGNGGAGILMMSLDIIESICKRHAGNLKAWRAAHDLLQTLVSTPQNVVELASV